LGVREVQDHYFRQAKREGYLSRAAYKLIEIDDRKMILHKGDRVLDCGAAPGSWLQVAGKRIGPSGLVVGIDLEPATHRFNQSNIRLIQDDFTTIPPMKLLHFIGGGTARFDVIISDMAPSTSGDPGSDHFKSARLCEAVLDRCALLLRAGGTLLMKVFEGESYPGLLRRTGAMFDSAKGYKPKASRSESREMYIIATGFAPATAPAPNQKAAPLRTNRSTGWTQR
jgi:23S rRNA (uridine2552-2'-O)-methyltransferase